MVLGGVGYCVGVGGTASSIHRSGMIVILKKEREEKKERKKEPTSEGSLVRATGRLSDPALRIFHFKLAS